MHEGCEVISAHVCRVARKCLFFLHLLGPPRHVVLEFVVAAYAATAAAPPWRSLAGQQRHQHRLFDVDLQLGLAGAIFCVDRSLWPDSVAVN